MKAALASALTALVLVTGAWASNVTPAQLSALSKRVTALEKTNAALGARVSRDETYAVRCANTYYPATVHGLTIDNPDGTTSTETEYGVPGAGKTDFWFVGTADPTCRSAK